MSARTACSPPIPVPGVDKLIRENILTGPHLVIAPGCDHFKEMPVGA
jgi:hypothetical protein